jgi:predicted permease
MHAVLRDIRIGARSLLRARALSSVAIIALALGIGLTTTMFSIVYAAVLKDLPFPDAGRLVAVARQNLARGEDMLRVTMHDFADYRSQQKSFTGLAAYYAATANVSGTERAERYEGAWVSSELFDVLGVRPTLGRTFSPGEETPGAGNVVVISDAMWRERYAGNRQILGTGIRVNGTPHTIVGVMPEGFAYPSRQALWMPMALDLTQERGRGQNVNVVGRLRPGVTLDAAHVDMATIARRLATDFKPSNEGISATVRPIIESEIGRGARALLWTMLGAVFLVLLIACANVANLLLDRAAHRTKEVGVRAALGASRSAVVRQFLSEALVLAMIGAALGAILSQVGITLFNRAIVDTEPPYWLDIRLHPPVLLFAVLMAVVASLFSGALPAWQSSRTDLSSILKDESRGASSFRIGRLSRGLVVFEVALSCGLLVASGLMIKSVVRLRDMNPGVVTQNVFTARVGLPPEAIDEATRQRFGDDLETRLAAIPSVEAVSFSSSLPGVCCSSWPVAIEGATYPNNSDIPSTGINNVSAGFFTTFQVSAVKGRVFAPTDRGGTLPVAIVNEAFVRKFLPSTDPLGARIRTGDLKSTEPWRTIVGVIPNIFSGDTEKPWDPSIYVPLSQGWAAFVNVALRSPDPLSLSAQVRATVREISADSPVYWIYTMDEAIARGVWHVRVFGGLFMVFGVVALLLAAVGLYAVMAFSVSRRTREVGIRMALGAQGGHVLQLVFRQGIFQLVIGVTLGLAMAAGLSQLVAALLFDVQPRDPVVFGGVVAALSASGLLACLIPALRAARVDPLQAMRE